MVGGRPPDEDDPPVARPAGPHGGVVIGQSAQLGAIRADDIDVARPIRVPRLREDIVVEEDPRAVGRPARVERTDLAGHNLAQVGAVGVDEEHPALAEAIIGTWPDALAHERDRRSIGRPDGSIIHALTRRRGARDGTLHPGGSSSVSRWLASSKIARTVVSSVPLSPRT